MDVKDRRGVERLEEVEVEEFVNSGSSISRWSASVVPLPL